MPDERHSTMSDSEILTRIDAVKSDLGGKIDGLSLDVQGIRQDMTVWRKEFVAQAVYLADERTRAEIRKQLEEKDDEQGEEIANLQAEATRKARERRNMWTAIVVAIVGALVAGMFTVLGNNNRTPLLVCVPAAGQQTCSSGN